MLVSSYLRMALMFGENKAQTLYKNLEGMISLVLYENELSARELYPRREESFAGKLEKPVGLSVVEIIDELKSKYSLDFSDSEIFYAIQDAGRSKIICVEDGIDSAQRKYAITPEEYVRISKKESENKTDQFILLFLESHPDISLSAVEMHELLNRHFYTVFNSNAATILDLLNNNFDYAQHVETEQFEFSNVEKEAINQFLYWNDPEKNKFVYEMVSCCFDYCMMTIKQNNSAYKSIFNKKEFYLDANIIFRLMGLNHESRKKVLLRQINNRISPAYISGGLSG